MPTWTGSPGPVLQLSRFPAVTHPTADRARCCWTSSSAVPFSGGHPSLCRQSPVLLDPFFGCLLFRRSPIQVPSWSGSPGPVLQLSRFSAVTHPTAEPARCCLTFFFEFLLFRRSPIEVPTSRGLHLRLYRFSAVTHPTAEQARCCWTSSSAVPYSGGHPSHCRPVPVLLDLFLRFSPLQSVSHPSADLDRFSWTCSSGVPFSGCHPSHC